MHKELTQMIERISDLTVFNNYYLFTFIVCTFNIQKMERKFSLAGQTLCIWTQGMLSKCTCI